MEFKWTFPQFIVDPEKGGIKNVVIGINWICTASDDQLAASSNGSVSLANPNPAEFVPYDKITYEMVYDWVAGRISMPDVEAKLAEQIDLLKQSQPQVQPPPF